MKKSLNIWAVSKYSSLPGYGPAARLFRLASNFEKQGHNTLLITSDANHLCNFPKTEKIYNNEIIEGIRVCWLKTKKYKVTASLSRIISWVDFEIKLFFLNVSKFPRPDIILVSSLSLLSILNGYYFKKKFRCKLVFEIRDIWPLTMTEEGGFSKWHPLVCVLGLVEKFGYAKSDLIVGTMPRLDEHVRQVMGTNKPFFCSPLGFEKAEPLPIKEGRKSNLQTFFPKGKIIVGYCGSMGISNALENFIQCIKNLSSHSGIHFVLVGEGGLKKKYMKDLDHEKNVTFVSRISSSEVPHFLEHCDILYLSTHDSKVWKFGQSMNKMVEYMLSAKPIIASYSGFPSMLNEANSGEFVLPGSSNRLKNVLLKYASLDEKERVAIGRRGYDWIIVNRSYAKLSKEYLLQLKKITQFS